VKSFLLKIRILAKEIIKLKKQVRRLAPKITKRHKDKTKYTRKEKHEKSK
jgi:hypothetical protein